MARLTTSDTFESRHSGLAARLKGVVGSLQLTRDLLVCDAQEALGRGRHLLALKHDPANAAICEQGAGGALVYDAAQPEMALAALLARIGEAMGERSPVSADPESLTVYALAERLAPTEVPVLITGPTGAGKEVLARHVHSRSARADAPFVALNCAAIPEAMLEAMLFGHQKGAFTGAAASSPGFFREADGGTLLLDEIAEMPLALQAKLLRALQEGEITPVGATRPVKVDVRIVACANRDLPQEVAEGRFREDLYYRLNVFPLHLPSLRERPGDIAPLAAAMLLRHRDGAGAPAWFSPAVLHALQRHTWPGNVRELENVIRRALVLAQGEREIGIAHIVFDKPASPAAEQDSDTVCNPLQPETGQGASKLGNIVRMSEARAILNTLRECGGKRIEAARRLGISERTLRYRLASYREAGVAMEMAL